MASGSDATSLGANTRLGMDQRTVAHTLSLGRLRPTRPTAIDPCGEADLGLAQPTAIDLTASAGEPT